MFEGKEEKRKKLAEENARAEFDRIINAFGFSISTDVKERVINMKVNGIDMSTNQEAADADAFISRIQDGKIKFDAEKTHIVYVLADTIKTGEGGAVETKEIRFRKLDRGMQKSIKAADSNGKEKRVNLREINFGTMDDDTADAVLMAMTRISDIRIINALTIPEYNDLRMVGGYFFS